MNTLDRIALEKMGTEMAREIDMLNEKIERETQTDRRRIEVLESKLKTIDEMKSNLIDNVLK